MEHQTIYHPLQNVQSTGFNIAIQRPLSGEAQQKGLLLGFSRHVLQVCAVMADLTCANELLNVQQVCSLTQHSGQVRLLKQAIIHNYN